MVLKWSEDFQSTSISLLLDHELLNCEKGPGSHRINLYNPKKTPDKTAEIQLKTQNANKCEKLEFITTYSMFYLQCFVTQSLYQ